MPKLVNWITNCSSPPIFRSGVTQTWSSSNRKNLSSDNFDIIGGGTNNISSGACSAILGGQGNNDSGLNDVFIAGSAIAAVNPGTLHINALWANAIPGPFGAVPILPPGTVYFGPAGVPGGNVLYIV
jgi:hypothetical protein